MGKIVELQVKAHSIGLSCHFSSIELLATFGITWHNKNIHEGATVCVLPFFVENALATTFNSQMSAVAYNTPVDALVSITES